MAPSDYAIRVRGALDPAWLSWFEGMDVHSDRPGISVIAGPVADQAALYGLLEKIRDLRVPIISVNVLVAGASGAIGRQLVPVLSAAGHEVVGLARSASATATLAVDALDRDALVAAVRG